MFEGDLGYDKPETGAQSVMDSVQFGNNARVHRGNVSTALGKDFLTMFYGGQGGDVN